MGVYLYGAIRPSEDPPATERLVQPAQGGLRIVDDGRVAALVAGVAAPTVAVTATNLAAHHEVVETVARRCTVLPARFGMVVPSDREVVDGFLAPMGPLLDRMLEQLEGLVELRVTLRHGGDAALREAVEASPQIRRIRRRVQGRPPAATYYDRIALGEAVMHHLSLLQQQDFEAFHGRLRGTVRASKTLEAGDATTLRLAYLVERRLLARFEQEIESYADEQVNRVTLEAVGPLAPWDFCELPEPDAARPRRSRASALSSSRRRWDS